MEFQRFFAFFEDLSQIVKESPNVSHLKGCRWFLVFACFGVSGCGLGERGQAAAYPYDRTRDGPSYPRDRDVTSYRKPPAGLTA